MTSASDLITAKREAVLSAYISARDANRVRFLEGDKKATPEYIFPNQKEDAANIVDKFYRHGRRVISIQKKTKVGADGLMIELATLMTTHNDDSFVLNPTSVRIITGMSNAGWEKDMKDKAPECFKDKIFHHGQLSRADLMSMRDGLIIIDEIDTGDKEFQKLHNTLEAAGILDVKFLVEHNNRLVIISATMIKEQYDVARWGELHEPYKMTIPSSYIGHKEFMERGILQEFYPLDTDENAERWVQEDILDNYGTDNRVHFVRLNPKTADIVRRACERMGISFRNHTSSDRLSDDDIEEFFEEPLTRHIVVGVRGLLRRANLIPNAWKLRIGATHEHCTRKVDNNVQIQGLPGRMTGYWRSEIEGGHKTGPYRTSLKAVEEYEKAYLDPFGSTSYQTAGFQKKKGKVRAEPTMLSPKNIANLDAVSVASSAGGERDPRQTVPIVLSITPEEYATIRRGKSKQWNYATLVPIIEKYRPDLLPELRRIEESGGRDQIVEPREAGTTSYSEYITSFVAAAAENTVRRHRGNIRDDTKDTFQIYLDKFGHRVIITIYYGSRVVEL